MNTQTSLSVMELLNSSNLKSGTMSVRGVYWMQISYYQEVTSLMLSAWLFCTIIVYFLNLNAHLIREKYQGKNATIVVHLLERIIKISPWINSRLSLNGNLCGTDTHDVKRTPRVGPCLTPFIWLYIRRTSLKDGHLPVPKVSYLKIIHCYSSLSPYPMLKLTWFANV